MTDPINAMKLVRALLDKQIGTETNLACKAILDEALERAEKNQFNPDWDAMAVMVEEQQRMARRIEELEQAQKQESEAWAKRAMELATDFAVESLRVGSYERKDSYENSSVASWQTVEIRAKREAARDRLRQYLYTTPQVTPQVTPQAQKSDWQEIECPACGDMARAAPPLVCSGCAKTDTKDSMWAVYCVDCWEKTK